MIETPLCTVEQLASMANKNDVVVLDCSWFLPTENRDPDAEFELCHIPNSQRFNIDGEFANPDTDLPHMLPEAHAFQDSVRTLGISRSTTVVCYDSDGIFAAPRAWWMFRSMGHVNTAVLNGGLVAWKAARLGTEAGIPPRKASGNFEAAIATDWIRTAEQVRSHLKDQGTVVLDARPAARFSGETPEPRPGLRSGAMPGARNLPFGEVLTDIFLKSAAEIEATFAEVGVTKETTLITSCGSGVTASILAFAANYVGIPHVSVYDGSWAEWGAENRTDLPVIKTFSTQT